MVSENQTNVTMPLGILQRLDKFLETKEAAQMGVTSRPQAILMLLREFLDKYQPLESKINQKDEIKLVSTIDDKIILNDSEVGTIIVEIDKDKKLQYYADNEDSHDNKWVRFCLKNKDLWDFLKKHGVKIITNRPKDKDRI